VSRKLLETNVFGEFELLQARSKLSSSCEIRVDGKYMGTQTTVTKWISKLAGGLFVRTLLVCDGQEVLKHDAGVKAAAEAEGMSLEAIIDITCDLEVIRRSGWAGRDKTVHVDVVGGPTWNDKKYGKIGYGAAVVDGVSIYPGDFVTVRYVQIRPCPTSY
jgi:hypothetical protein